MPSSFHRTLDQLRSIAETEREKGALFERLMREYFTEDPVYGDRFANVWLWAEWPAHYPGFDRADTGIDLVAQERDGSGYCAIQCKCYAPGTTVGKPHLDSFVSASARDAGKALARLHLGYETCRKHPLEVTSQAQDNAAAAASARARCATRTTRSPPWPSTT